MLKTVINKAIDATGFMLLRKEARPYDFEGLQTWNNAAFLKDPNFLKAQERGFSGAQGQASCPAPWRLHIAIWAAQTAMRREGDFVECGVYLGFVSSVIMTYLKWNETNHNKRFYLVDSYEGLDPTTLTERERELGRAEQYSNYRGTYPRALKNLAEFKNTELIKGYVPQVLPQVKAERLAYLHIDMNSAVPEVAALEYFWPKMTTGGVVLLDDYAFIDHKLQKHALDELAARLGFSIASLPTGQGLVIK